MPSLLKRILDIPQQIIQAAQSAQAAQTQTPTLPAANGWVGAAGPNQTGNPAVEHWADPDATVSAVNVPAPALATTDYDASITQPTNNYSYTVPPEGGTQNGQPAQNPSGEQVVLSAQTGEKPNAAVTVSETNGNTQSTDALTVTGSNGGTLTDSSSTTVTNGNTATTDTSSTGISTNGTVTLTDGQSTTVTNGSDSTTTADSTTVTAGNGSFGVSTSNTNTTVTDGQTDTTTGGVNASVNTEDGTATVGGNYSQNGNGVSGGVTFDENGVESVTGTATVHQGNFEGSLTGTFSEDQTQISASGGANGVKVGVTYENTHGQVTQSAVTENDHSPIANVLDGGGYLSTTRTDETKLGGSIGIKGLGVSGDITSGSTFQTFERLPADWESWNETQRSEYQAQQAARMDDINGMADVNLADLVAAPDGTGFRYVSYNGWNASAGLSYGAVSVTGGGGQSSAHDVTIVNDGGMLTVSMARQDGVSNEMGAALYGVGINLGSESSDTHQFQFQVNPNDPEAMAAMEVFMQTGLLPGTGNLQGENAQRANQRFDAARDQVDTLTGDIGTAQEALDQLMTQPGYEYTQEFLDQQQALHEMYRQLDNAQAQMETNRNYLNDQWEAQYGVTQNPMDGVTITQETDTHQETDTVGGTSPLGDVELGRTERTWVEQEYLNNVGSMDHLFAYDEKNYFLGNMTDQQSVQTNTDENGIVFAMYSDNGITVSENADAIRDIENSDLPDYVLDAWDERGLGTQFLEGINPLDNPIYNDLAGRTTVAMNQEQWNAMATNLNDMNNPESAAMWADFAERSAAFMGGEQYAHNVGDENQNAHFQQGMDAQRDSWLADVSSRDPATDPLAAGLYSFGTDDPEAAMQEASRHFADVKTPADFQKLTPDQQQLYIAVLDMTSGQDADLTGERNSFEALGPIALIEDETARAESLRNLFVSANDEASNGGNYSDGVFEFLEFTDRFKDDPATYDMIQQGISFDWKQENIENRAEDRTPEEVARDFNDAYWSESGIPHINRHHDPDEGRAFEAMQVAIAQGGPAAVQAMIEAAGANPETLLDSIDGDPLRQRMMYDMLVGAGYDEELEDYDLA